VLAETVAEVVEPPELPEALPLSAWDEVDRIYNDAEYWDFQNPSRFAHPTKLLVDLAAEL